MLLVAGIWLASNLTKPLTVDDAAYYAFARHVAAHPADPYGFSIYWYQEPQPAIDVLAPPVWLYWWAAGIRVFGDHEWAWKLWQFPLIWLFVAAVTSLARRFVREPVARLLPAFVVLSPIFLPGLNLMLDVPALALGLAAFALFTRASDRESVGGAVVAGLVAGLAMQTKYTGLLVPAAMLLYAALLGRTRLALAAAGVAAAVFASWETAMLWCYGQSQFLASLTEPGGGLGGTWSLVPSLVTLAGGVGSAWGFLGLAALGTRRRAIGAAMLASFAGFVALGWLPARTLVLLPDAMAAILGRPGIHLNPALDLYRLLGIFVLVVMVSTLVRLRRDADRTDWFLIGWLALEITGYLLLNPFVAVRRVMGLGVVATLTIGRLANRTHASAGLRHAARAVVCYNAALAILFAVTDRADAVAQRDGAARAAAAAHALLPEPEARPWYVGHWGFQFYAERAGMEAVVPGTSRLREGHLLVVPGSPVDAQRIDVPPSSIKEMTQLDLDDGLPWRTVPIYYRGAVPLSVRPTGPRLRVTVYRVTADFVPDAWRAR